MNKRLKEILERKKEIRTQIESDEEVDFEKLNTEIDELDKEQRSIEAREAVAQKLNDGEKSVEARVLGGSNDLEVNQRRQTKPTEMRWDEAIETTEYRDAWAKQMMDKALSQEERELMDSVNTEYRADFLHNTSNTEVLIPKTISDGIWKRAEEVSALWSAVHKLRVRGNITLITGERSEKARFYDEATAVESDELKFGELNLTGHELAKAIDITWKLKKMAIQDFVAYIMREIGERMGEALSYAVYEGIGSAVTGSQKPEPLGIKTALQAEANTPRILTVETAGELSYKDLTKLRAAIKSAYAQGSAIYANNLTIWNVLANVVDGIGRPMFMADAINGSVGRILGVPVFPDVGVPEGELMTGNLPQGYTANINEDITMHTEEHMKKRITEYMGYAIVDGAPKDTHAFAILEIGETP